MRRMQRIALVMLVISGAVNYLDRSALAIGNPEIRKELGLDATQMGVLLSAFLVSYAFAQLPVGLLVDRVGPRKLLGLGLTVWSLAQTLAGFVGSLSQLWWARLFLGVGEAPQFPSGARVVSDWFNVKDRGSNRRLQLCRFDRPGARSPDPHGADARLRLADHVHHDGRARVYYGRGLVRRLPGSGTARDCRGSRLYPGRGYSPDCSGDPSQWASLFRLRTTWGMVCGNLFRLPRLDLLCVVAGLS